MRNCKTNKTALLAAVGALIAGYATSLHINLATSNIFTLVFFLAYYIIIKKAFENATKKICIVSSVVGFMFSLFLSFGKLVSLVEGYEDIRRILYFAVYLIGFGFLFSSIMVLIYTKIENALLLTEKTRNTSKPRLFLVLLITTAILLCAWLVYFLADYPANITPDSNSQMLQAIGKQAYSNHHPFIHTMLIRVIFDFGLLIFNGNQTHALALYAVFQAIMLALSFAYLAQTMYKFNFKRRAIALVTAFFALMPYHGIFSMTVWKDVLFGAIVLVLTITLWRIVVWYKNGNKKLPVFDAVMLFIFGVLMCLFRSNGLYAFVLLFLVFALLFFKKSIVLVLVSAIALGCALVVKGPVYSAIGVTEPDTIESLSVPAQHIARAIVCGAELSDNDRELLSQVVDVDRIGENYSPYISDPIKELVREKDNQEYLSENKLEFLKLWIKLGVKNPGAYLLAQIDQTVGYWYPDVQYWVYLNSMDAEGLECIKDFKVPILFRNALYGSVNLYRVIYYVGLLWSIGTFTWVIIAMVGFAFIKRKKEDLLLFIPVVAILLTLMIATPVHAEFRYAYSLFTTTPLLVVFLFGEKKKEID